MNNRVIATFEDAHRPYEATVDVFEYGNGYRVKCVVVSLDPGNSFLMRHSDMYYEKLDRAQAEFDALVRQVIRDGGQVRYSRQPLPD